LLPESLVEGMGVQVKWRRRLHEVDLERGADPPAGAGGLSSGGVGAGWVPMPYAQVMKTPAAGRSLGWQFVFASQRLVDWPVDRLLMDGEGETGGAPLEDGKAMEWAVGRLGVTRPFGCASWAAWGGEGGGAGSGAAASAREHDPEGGGVGGEAGPPEVASDK
jgi:hypothetical protein